jgi:N-acylneuraminate cytidylyltransferase
MKIIHGGINLSKNIAIIPARKGSKRFPSKNNKKIYGINLVELTIIQAIESNTFESIILTTDDLEFEYLKEKYTNLIFDYRDDTLSNDSAPLIDVIQYIINKFNIDYNDTISLLQVTNPLRTVKNIIEGIYIYTTCKKKSTVVSVTASDCPAELLWILTDGYLRNNTQISSIRKQDYPTYYKYNDVIVIDSVGRFLQKNRTLFGESPIPYIMPMWTGVYIDYEWQYEIIKLIKENEQFNKF